MSEKLTKDVEVAEIGVFFCAYASAEVLKALGIVESGTLVRLTFATHDVGRVPLRLDKEMTGSKVKLNLLTAGFLGASVGDTVTITA